MGHPDGCELLRVLKDKTMKTTNNSLRARIIDMKPGQTIAVSLATNKSNTIYNYASFLGRELDRVYTTRFDKVARVVIVKREA